MRRLVSLLSCALLAGCASAAPNQPSGASPSIAFSHVNVVDVENGRVLPDQTVLLSGHRIREVAPAGRLRMPSGTRVVEAAGKYLIPGLWDMHVHSAGNADRDFALYVAHGITGVRNMHTTVDTALQLTISIKRRLRDGTLVGPRFIANGPILDGVGSVWTGSAVIVRGTDNARAVVDSLLRGGADFIKLYDYLPRDAFFAAVAEAQRRHAAAAVHVPYSVSSVEAAEAGVTSIEHMRGLEWDCSTIGDSLRAELTGVVAALAAGRANARELFPLRERTLAAAVATRDEARCAAAIAALGRHGTWVVPTLGWGSNDAGVIIADSARMRYVSPSTRTRWAQIVAEDQQGPESAWAKRSTVERRNIALLRRAGVRILAGTDTGDDFLIAGFALHDDLEQLVATGLTPAEALRAATLNPARFLAATDSLGTVAPGKVADLVLLDANPLVDINGVRRIRAVVLNGRYLDRQALDTMLSHAQRAATR